MINFFRNILSHNQKGFSLPEIMIVLGILGGVSLMATNLIVDQNSNESYLKARIEIKNMMSFVQESIGDKKKCEGMLRGKLLAAENSSIPLPSLNVPGQTKEILKSNTEYKGFKIEGIELYTDQRINPVPSSNTEFELVPVRINVDFRIKSKSLFSNSDRIIKETIPLYVTMHSSQSSNRMFKDCEVVYTEKNDTAKEKFCKSISGVAQWDTTNKKCSFRNDRTCPPGHVLVKTLHDLKTMDCTPALGVMQLSDLFDTTSCKSTGTFRIINSSGKLKIDCTKVINCAGSWSPCDCATGMQTYTITTPASGGGLACPFANNQTQSCTRQYGWVETIYSGGYATCVSAPTSGPGACTSGNVGAHFVDTTCQLKDVTGVWTSVPNCQGPDCTEVDKFNLCKCI